ncbi:MAG: CinA family protein [Pirellulaceae bacterium]
MPNQQMMDAARELAFELSALLREQRVRIVFAESCTAGLASALLAQVPGISEWMCGSAVTYRESAKQAWLGIDAGLIAEDSAVSAAVTQKMSEQVLHLTPEADLSLAVTGHLEETATDEPCHAWICTCSREGDELQARDPEMFSLTEPNRRRRQWQAACLVLETAVRSLKVASAEQK